MGDSKMSEEKFKDIKVGDYVLLRKGLRLKGVFGPINSYYVKCKVEKVTSKQFVVEGDRYRKDTGRLVGDSFYAYKEGEKYIGTIIKDETDKYNHDKEIRHLISNLKYYARKIIDLNPIHFLNEPIDDLEHILHKLKELKVDW